jgi:hypothetical protein
MTDRDANAFRRQYRGMVLALTAPECWQNGEVIITDGMIVFTAAKGSMMRTVPCVICGQMVLGSRFTLHHLTMPQLCEAGNPHLLAVTVARHMSCGQPDSEMTADLILAAIPCMTD